MGRSREKTAGLVLAAGTSSRMGATKQLLRIGGKLLVERAVEEALKSNLDQVVLVLGHRAGTIRNALASSLKDTRLRVVENRGYRNGMGSSIRTAIREVEDHVEHVMILLADMVHIDAHVINALLEGYLASGKSLGAVCVRGRRSHPVILERKWYAALHDLREDAGARALFDAFADEVCLVAAPFGYDDLDLDTPEDYRKALQETVEE